MMDVKERIANIVDDSGNCTIADPCHPELPCCECQANAILAIDINGITLGELIKKRDRLVELREDQTPPVSYWKHGVEIPIAPEVSGRYFEHVWMKVKGLVSEDAEGECEGDYNPESEECDRCECIDQCIAPRHFPD